MKNQLKNTAILFLIAIAPTYFFVIQDNLDIINTIFIIISLASFCFYLSQKALFIKMKKMDNLISLNDGYVKGMDYFVEGLMILVVGVSVYEVALSGNSASMILMLCFYLSTKGVYMDYPYIGEKYLYTVANFPNSYIEFFEIVSSEKSEYTKGSINPKTIIKYDLELKNGRKIEIDFNRVTFSKEKEQLLDKAVLIKN